MSGETCAAANAAPEPPRDNAPGRVARYAALTARVVLVGGALAISPSAAAMFALFWLLSTPTLFNDEPPAASPASVRSAGRAPKLRLLPTLEER